MTIVSDSSIHIAARAASAAPLNSDVNDLFSLHPHGYASVSLAAAAGGTPAYPWSTEKQETLQS